MRITIFLVLILAIQQASSGHLPIHPQRCPYRQCCCCSHFVYALDESGSMRGTRWNVLRTTMSRLRNNIGDNFGKHYMTTYEFSHVAQNPNFNHRRPSLFNINILNHNGGGTNFNKALLKGISIISGYLNENTCFNLITDGLSSWSVATANLFNSILQRVRRNGCKACAYCYFIKRTVTTQLPTQFKRLCNKIGAPIRHV